MDFLREAIELSGWGSFVDPPDPANQSQHSTQQQHEPICRQQAAPTSWVGFDTPLLPTDGAATALLQFSTSIGHLQTTPSPLAEAINDGMSMPPPPLKHYPKPPAPTPINYGRSVSYIPPRGSRSLAKARPPVYDNVTIPPHLINIIQRDTFGLANKTNSVILPPPERRDYNLLSAWYIAANDKSTKYKTHCMTFLRHQDHYASLALAAQGLFRTRRTPSRVWFSSGVEQVKIDGDVAQHIEKTNCEQCLVHAFREAQERIRRKERQGKRGVMEMQRTVCGGVNRQVGMRRRGNLKRKLPRKVELRGSGGLVGGDGLPEEYARAFERWDEGMKESLPGYAGSKWRRMWFETRDQTGFLTRDEGIGKGKL